MYCVNEHTPLIITVEAKLTRDFPAVISCHVENVGTNLIILECQVLDCFDQKSSGSVNFVYVFDDTYLR